MSYFNKKDDIIELISKEIYQEDNGIWIRNYIGPNHPEWNEIYKRNIYLKNGIAIGQFHRTNGPACIQRNIIRGIIYSNYYYYLSGEYFHTDKETWFIKLKSQDKSKIIFELDNI